MDGDDGLLCARCGMIERVRQTLEVDRFALILIIQLKRFDDSSRHLQKNNTIVDYPCRFNAAQYTTGQRGFYDLIGVICHSESLNDGHCTSVVRAADDIWYEIWDESVWPRSDKTAPQLSGALGLFYQKVDDV
jgi:ubiquitin C-terminal hydrolase